MDITEIQSGAPFTGRAESIGGEGRDEEKPSRDDLTKMEASEAGFPLVAQ
jgi:hypothetical protein